MARGQDAGRATDVDGYMAAVPEDARAVLEALRGIIRAAAPGAEERLSYRIPTFFDHGGLVAISASKGHCGLYLMSPSTMEALREELRDLRTTTATVRFPHGEPLPTELIGRLVGARVAENEARAGRRGSGRS